jgi:hypothetical protein
MVLLGFKCVFVDFSWSANLRYIQMMNEPHRGYINVPSLHAFDYNTDLHLSHVRKYS